LRRRIERSDDAVPAAACQQQKTPSGGDGVQERVKGLEPFENPAVSKVKAPFDQKSGAKAALPLSPPVPADPDLHLIISAWPTLPPVLRAGVLALVKSATSEPAR